MRIVVFNKQEKAGGGIGVVTQRFKNFLRKRGHEVFEIRYTKEKRSKEFIRIPYIFADKNTTVYVPSFQTKKLVENALVKIKPDLIYVPIGGSTFDLLLPGICRKLGIRLVGVSHTDISRSNRLSRSITSVPFRIVTPFCKKLDRLQVFSQELRGFFVERGVDRKRIVVISNGVDQKKYSPGRSSFKKTIKAKKIVLFLGRLTWIKNPEILIKAFLKVGDLDARLVFAGRGDLEKKLKEKYEKEGIVFLGHLSDEKKKIDLIRASDVMVLPSSYEGMSLSLLEGMACGKCCIATDVGNHKEVLDGAGIVIPLGKLKEQLPIVLKQYLNDSKKREMLGKKARRRVVSLYSEDVVFSKIVGVFEKLVN